jgi:protein-S-isoprenylcysteine O-methyltransferase Ste14
MNNIAALIVNLDFWLIGLLPFTFFRRDGSWNLRWWATAFPLFAAPTVVATVALTGLKLPYTVHYGFWQDALCVTAACASIGLVCFTQGTHRVRLALWHQDNDAPQSIVTEGAYRRIRHPFYTSFILAMTAATLALANPIMLGLEVWLLLVLNYTAAREESNLLASSFGSEYSAYVSRSGRFFPRLGAT